MNLAVLVLTVLNSHVRNKQMLHRNPPMFRFTIRDVLWLTVVVGLTVGWWLDRSRIAKERDQVQLKVFQLVGEAKATREEMLALKQLLFSQC